MTPAELTLSLSSLARELESDIAQARTRDESLRLTRRLHLLEQIITQVAPPAAA